jgi:transmembrane sensor
MSFPQTNASGEPRPVDPNSPTLDAIVVDVMADEVVLSVHRATRRRAMRQRILASGSVLALAVAGIFWRGAPEASRLDGAFIQMASDTTLVRKLADGSIVDLNRGAEIRVVFEADVRRVELLKGEAHFQVEKDPSRPFVVTAGNVSVRAVGTGFAVQFGREAVEVIVTEGRIAVGRVDAPTVSAAAITEPAVDDLELVSGQRITVPQALPTPPAPEAISVADMKTRLQWRVPLLELGGTPLGEALVAFNRYGDRRLQLADAELAQLELSGVLRADNVDALLRLLHDEFSIVAELRGDGVILRRR